MGLVLTIIVGLDVIATRLLPTFIIGAFVLVFAGLAGVVRAWNHAWKEQCGPLDADESGLHLAGRYIVRRSAVRHGSVVERNGRAFLNLRRALGQVEVEVDDAEAQRILEAMRLDSRRFIGQFVMNRGTTRGTKLRAFVALVLFVFVAVASVRLGRVRSISIVIPTLLVSLLSASAILHAYAFRARLRVHVGTDGLG